MGQVGSNHGVTVLSVQPGDGLKEMHYTITYLKKYMM